MQGTEDLSKDYADLNLDQLPRCTKGKCQGLLRPAVGESSRHGVCRCHLSHHLKSPSLFLCTVWFGESIPLIPKIEAILDKCDLLLVLGTSSTVYPAAGFAAQVQSKGGKIAVFNTEKSGERADYYFEGGVESTLPWALGMDDDL